MAPWTLARLERAVEGFSAQLQCAICLCAYEKPVSLPCNHCFCEECIHRALELKTVCPICKTPAKKRRLRYDATVQELLRATEMLCAAPDASASAAGEQQQQTVQVKVKTEKTPAQAQAQAAAAAAPVVLLDTDESMASESEKQLEKQLEAAAVAAPANGVKVKTKATPERRASPRRPAKRLSNSQTKSPSSQTQMLMDAWVSGASSQPRNGLKIKTEKVATPVRRASPRRTLAHELNSQVHASPLSPALFEIAAPRTVHAQTPRVNAQDARTKLCGDDMEEEAPSMDDSDSASSPQGHKNGKRKLFSEPKSGRWVKIRSLKYLKALVGGRWIVSDEWLQACADHGGYVSEVNYEADGHWKGRRIHDAVKRSRLTREKLLQLSAPDVDRANVGTMLFADFCFHVIGEFLPPMPPITELNTLVCMGGGKLIAFMDEIPEEMHKRENRTRKLIIVSDKINPIALRQLTRQLKTQPQVNAVSSAIIVNYLWVINSISEAKLRELP
ncbi:BREAST CANCER SUSCEPTIBILITY 1 protein [Phytophthora cinnamomi]|uniref:BREAST CANCER SUSCEPTIBILITY 1 protein n=1 Tax=Phytophthora cinnamomi TaxID=4785 RepID=UPI003559EB5C|nr:BREAST CANCER SUSCEPTIBILITY 1 protein [Phytophthora cinnamomi]